MNELEPTRMLVSEEHGLAQETRAERAKRKADEALAMMKARRLAFIELAVGHGLKEQLGETWWAALAPLNKAERKFVHERIAQIRRGEK